MALRRDGGAGVMLAARRGECWHVGSLLAHVGWGANMAKPSSSKGLYIYMYVYVGLLAVLPLFFSKGAFLVSRGYIRSKAANIANKPTFPCLPLRRKGFACWLAANRAANKPTSARTANSQQSAPPSAAPGRPGCPCSPPPSPHDPTNARTVLRLRHRRRWLDPLDPWPPPARP